MNNLKELIEALPEKIKQTGRTDEEPLEIFLKAGQLNTIYSKGALRYISAGNNELIRMISVAVRDKNWLTIPPTIEYEKI